jgi:hypothetical protein
MALGATEANIASLPKQRSDGYREHYANNCQIRFTPFDVTILFTFLKEWDGQIVNEAQTAVTLSPLQFKALLLTGATLLEGFEQTFGELARRRRSRRRGASRLWVPCPPGHRQHRAVVLRAFIPAVCLARCIRRESLIDRRLDPPTALAIWLVNHIGRPLLGQTPAHLASLWGAKAPPS